MTRAVRIAAALTAVVALGSGVLSWDALRWGAGQLGVDEHLTWIYPIVLDGMIGVGTVTALALRSSRRRVRAYIWTLLGSAIGASVVGNAAHAAGGSWVHVAGSALPALALAGSLHLLMVLVRESAPARTPAPASRRRSTSWQPKGTRPEPKRRRIQVLHERAAAAGESLSGAAVAQLVGASRQYANRELRKLRTADA